MKRQRYVGGDQNVKATKGEEGTNATRTIINAVGKKKKSKKGVEKEIEEKKIDDGGEQNSIPRRMADGYKNWGEWTWLGGGIVDEQMSWGSIWLPFWDVEYLGEACGEMFSDVVWDYDIWNLRNVNEISNP